ncbi:TRAP transporter small permease subunit [Rhodophyticola sp. CCM32]|uniref:TRAP transporter small permease n=1 Tax=Rhodophyticola sp. CCM32 TaxID=2916397 RepID=UPI00107FC901|nr:TRAP transporter small permease subunit [Rhodophyticola sp. CCM32]QBY01386.1 TRAP transporter small permease subunit [Rhodophyticola sp. CCM32]
MRHILKLLITLPAAVSGTALFALMVMTFSDVMLRSIFNAPIQAGADLTRLLMAVIVFSVLPLMSFRGVHISVDLLDQTFRRYYLARVRDVVVSLLCGVMLIWPAQRIWVLAERSRSYGDVMEYLNAPVHYLIWFISILTAATAAALIARGIIIAVRPELMTRPHG